MKLTGLTKQEAFENADKLRKHLYSKKLIVADDEVKIISKTGKCYYCHNKKLMSRFQDGYIKIRVVAGSDTALYTSRRQAEIDKELESMKETD